MIRRWMLNAVLFAIIASTIGCDQVTKQLATSHLKGMPEHAFLGGSLRLVYAENTGAFLSLGSELPAHVRTALFTVATAITLLVCAAALVRGRRARLTDLGLSLVIAGGFSNLIDRVAHGSVIDFLNVGVGSIRTGIFNVADMAIMLGVALVLLRLPAHTASRETGS